MDTVIIRRSCLAIAASAALTACSQGQVLYEELKLLPADGDRYDWFGERVDLRGGILAVGAIYDDDQADDAGAVYLYESSTGNFIIKLTADDGDPSDSFGRAVAIGNDIVAIGSSYDDDAGDDAGFVI